MRNATVIDHLITHFDQGLRTVFAKQAKATRESPAKWVDKEAEFTESERHLAASLLRVDEAGEVSAQALYQGQALTARRADLKATLLDAAEEENDHLAWCQDRLEALGAKPSYFNPVWYAGSFCIGALAGLIGDKWSLGFLAETEQQVVRHLDDHLQRLPADDHKSRRVLEQMREDELKHATTAQQHGGVALPMPIKKIMRCMSKVMTSIAYWI